MRFDRETIEECMRNAAERFLEAYAERSGVTVEWIRSQGMDVYACDCDEGDCMGWQVIRTASVEAKSKGLM